MGWGGEGYVYIRWGGGGTVMTGQKKTCFKTNYIAVLIKILLKCDRFLELQNVVDSPIHFNTS